MNTKPRWIAAALLAGFGMLVGSASCLAAMAPPLRHAIAHGRKTFASDTFGGSGLTCNSCHTDMGQRPGHLPNGATIPSLTNAAAIFPRYKPREHKVLTLDDQVRGCIAGALHGKPPAYGSRTLVDLVSYLGSLAKGKPVDIGSEPK